MYYFSSHDNLHNNGKILDLKIYSYFFSKHIRLVNAVIIIRQNRNQIFGQILFKKSKLFYVLPGILIANSYFWFYR